MGVKTFLLKSKFFTVISKKNYFYFAISIPGFPKTVVLALTFFITTLPNKILALLPILIFSPIVTLAPKKTSLPIFALFKIDVLEPKSEYDQLHIVSNNPRMSNHTKVFYVRSRTNYRERINYVSKTNFNVIFYYRIFMNYIWKKIFT